jgi:hypothetical protein
MKFTGTSRLGKFWSVSFLDAFESERISAADLKASLISELLKNFGGKELSVSQ